MKFFKTLSISSILILSILFLETCKPDEEVGKTYGPYTLGDAKAYLDFKLGSWWVYQHNKSGLYDTLVLKSISISTRKFEGKNTVIKDMVNMLIYSTSTGYEYKYYSSGANPDAKKEYLEQANFIELIHGKSKAGDYNGETVSFFSPFDKNHKGNISMFETSMIHTDTSIILPKLKVSNVVVFKCKDDACWDGGNTKYYWGKDIGLVKKENTEKNESWDLVSYQVIKP